ncbi:MAG: SDR family NAD(P)-dependent oxidoreductase [Proteobacteria bacterium]|nr:SDR family NAD(P)-dependent oxidoreductase [Pseudomonadota bacterium]
MEASARVVAITGAAGNLGRAVAAAFETRGARLALFARSEASLASAFGEPTERRMHVVADLLDRDAVLRAVASVIARARRIDVLVNVAGGFRMDGPVHATSATTFDSLFALNVVTLANMAHAVVPHMLAAGRGAIVNVGAFAASRGGAGMGAYAAAKSGVIRLTESMAAELRERGINVNCVLPTILDTPENRRDMPQADPSKWVALPDLAGVIAFLASDDARAVHGAAIPVTGLS